MTYTPLANITLTSAASSVTFSSIPQNYTDLILITDVTLGSQGLRLRFNNVTSANYFTVNMRGIGSSALSSVENLTYIPTNGSGSGSGDRGLTITQISDYSSTNKHKLVLIRHNRSGSFPEISATAGRWSNTAAITTVQVFHEFNAIQSGSTFALYGIAG